MLKYYFFFPNYHSQILSFSKGFKMQIAEEQRQVKVQIYHQMIGSHTFELSLKDHLSQLKTQIVENSPLYLYQNFHFEYEGKTVYEYAELSTFLKNDARFNIVFDPYTIHMSRHHEYRVKQILQNPTLWCIVNAKDVSIRNSQQYQTEHFEYQSLDQIFQKPFHSNFLSLNQIKEGEFSNIINYSGFNPPSHSRKLMGDFFYIYLKVFEQIDYHVTANSQGFFVNLSTNNNFNPNPHPKYTLSISLLELINQISPKFKQRFQQAQSIIKVTEFQKIIHNFPPIKQHMSWIGLHQNWKKNHIWKNDCYEYIDKNDYSALRDWIQIFQYQRVSPNDTFLQKIGKLKLKYKLYQQLIECAKDGVMKIFEGKISPINNSQIREEQVYYYFYLLFYFASPENNLSGVSQKQANQDILNLNCLDSIDAENLSLSHMIIVNYRGYKIVVRTIPSSFIGHCNDIESVKQLFAKNNQIQNDQVLSQLLKKICKHFGLESENKIRDDQGNTLTVIGNPDIKGFMTPDKKKFIFNLLRLSPRDFNFEGQQYSEYVLRPQIIKLYNNKQKCPILLNTILGTKYNVIYNDKMKQEQKKLKSIAKFAKQIMIPICIDSFDGQMRKYLSDSKGIMKVLHKHGLSSRYLGMIYKKAQQKQSHHVKYMIERVILIKSLKNLLKKLLKLTNIINIKTLIKNFFNNFFFEQAQPKDKTNGANSKYQEDDITLSKKKKKCKKERQDFFIEIHIKKPHQKYLNMTRNQIYDQIKLIALEKYFHKFDQNCDFFRFQFSRTAILRDLCLNLGIEIEKKQYFQNLQVCSFTQENIIKLVPICKFINFQSKELNDLIDEGDKLANKYLIEEAFQVYNKGLQYIFSAFGGAHQKLGLINKKISNIYYKIGDPDTAAIFIEHSCQIYQSLSGEDHVEVIEGYLMLGVYHFTMKRYDAAEHFILKAIFLAKFAYSECYPEVIVMHLNLSTVYQMQKKYTDAIMSLFLALSISTRIFGQNHIHTAICFSALASLHYQIPDIGQSIKYQEKSIQILEAILPPDDQRINEAKNIYEGFKNLQNSKKIKEIHQKQHKNSLGMQINGRFNLKMPAYQYQRERPTDFHWKKGGKKIRYFL